MVEATGRCLPAIKDVVVIPHKDVGQHRQALGKVGVAEVLAVAAQVVLLHLLQHLLRELQLRAALWGERQNVGRGGGSK